MDANHLSHELGALALAKSLFPHIENVQDLDEFLLYPPDLFALTSLILSTTGAYRLIVSPPRATDPQKSKRELWMPTEDENMRDFSEFNENSIDDFKNAAKLYRAIFHLDDDISKLLLGKMSADEKQNLTALYSDVKDKDIKTERTEFIPLEKAFSAVLNRAIQSDKTFYQEIIEEPGNKDLFSNINLPDEFWNILEQLDEIPNDDKADSIKRHNRLFLEAFYPYAINPSLAWNERVRKAGLKWRKNLGRNFDAKEFTQLKEQTEIKQLEGLIERLENFEEIVAKRDELKTMQGEVYQKRLERKIEEIKTVTEETGLTEDELSDATTRAEKVNAALDERSREIAKRRKIISEKIRDESSVPQILRSYWNNFRDEVSTMRSGKIKYLLCNEGNTAERSDFWQRFVSIVSLHAIADEACAGWGIRGPLKFLKEGLTGQQPSKSQQFAEDLLSKYGSLSTVSTDRCRVLPKRHTAEVGITLRSISCNLGFHRSSVAVKWRMAHTNKSFGGSDKPLTSLNVLLLPIPLEIHTTDFRRRDVPVKSHQNTQDFFEFNPDVFGVEMTHGQKLSKLKTDQEKKKDAFKERIKEILDNAREEVGRVDMVILPEIAIHEHAVKYLQEVLLESKEDGEPVTAYIAGVRESGERFNRNAVYFKVADEIDKDWKFSDEPDEYRQYKHHRWKLDRSQVVQYQLGGALSPTKSWWEAIKINDREVNFINIGEQLTVCPLICEDLARQDPISDLIRTVGPTLVVAILMDGPQLLRRWAGKYASVLGDDPGSAVITLTSYGMVRRSLVYGQEPSRIIALWSSPEAKTEIDLEKGAEAVLLSLSVDERKEKSADGREEMGGTPSLSLAGIRQIKLNDGKNANKILRC